ncbi:hypothetical protein Rsub_13031 [Raphidocelis subcapitata]|uniref:Uncharacterized protein n=1 Tax=Raphidocelis subcapitata TaxID=307507 RepID=A0A2V0PMK8_9CHLO|nr:hypothetical protein Rsub_13031 [Raphidocelis subcapitata]|eukprot:GBG00323.1 hypothetical protein Rsub_13031 [Raphidocelis subcapitata]
MRLAAPGGLAACGRSHGGARATSGASFVARPVAVVAARVGRPRVRTPLAPTRDPATAPPLVARISEAAAATSVDDVPGAPRKPAPLAERRARAVAVATALEGPSALGLLAAFADEVAAGLAAAAQGSAAGEAAGRARLAEAAAALEAERRRRSEGDAAAAKLRREVDGLSHALAKAEAATAAAASLAVGAGPPDSPQRHLTVLELVMNERTPVAAMMAAQEQQLRELSSAGAAAWLDADRRGSGPLVGELQSAFTRAQQRCMALEAAVHRAGEEGERALVDAARREAELQRAHAAVCVDLEGEALRARGAAQEAQAERDAVLAQARQAQAQLAAAQGERQALAREAREARMEGIFAVEQAEAQAEARLRAQAEAAASQLRAQADAFEQEKQSLQAALREAQAKSAEQSEQKQALAREAREARMAAASAAAEAEARVEARLRAQAATAQQESEALRAALREAQANSAERSAQKQAPRVKNVPRSAPQEPRNGSGAPAATQQGAATPPLASVPLVNAGSSPAPTHEHAACAQMHAQLKEARGKVAKVMGLLAAADEAVRTAGEQAAVLRAHVAQDPSGLHALAVLSAIEALAAEAAGLRGESPAGPAAAGGGAAVQEVSTATGRAHAHPGLEGAGAIMARIQAAKRKAGEAMALLAQRQARLVGERRTVALLGRILAGGGAPGAVAMGVAPAWLEAEAEAWQQRVARLRRGAAAAGCAARVCC